MKDTDKGFRNDFLAGFCLYRWTAVAVHRLLESSSLRKGRRTRAVAAIGLMRMTGIGDADTSMGSNRSNDWPLDLESSLSRRASFNGQRGSTGALRADESRA
ncbi:hypothetical protein [Paraburkholderia sp. RL17-337-BIB-A]|uniref:hypothetical protein n=1 Tax=Paraburkholderia sp. RL17-337-BIB-A TaxID=3031636 RepID=UPI0038BD50AC